MATKNTPNKTKKAEITKDIAIVSVETAEPEIQPVRPKTIKLDDSVLISTKSNVFGELIYVNPRTRDETRWATCGDTQTLTMGDLRAMKGTQRAFFENQWIYVIGVDEAGYEDVTPEDVYKALMVTQYYKNILDPDNYAEIFSWSPAKIRETISYMSDGAKMNFVVAANTSIADGSLDSIKKIQMIESCLGCELIRP